MNRPLVEILNALANEPEVLAQLGYTKLDFSDFYKHPGNVAIGDADGVALFGHRGQLVYEGHYIFSSRLRGKKALAAARRMIEYMFTIQGAAAIVGETPAANRAARLFSRALGFARQGTTTDSSGRPCVVYKMDRARWAILSAESLVA